MAIIANKSGYIYDGSKDLLIDTDDVKNIHLIENFISEEDLLIIDRGIKEGNFVIDKYKMHEYPLRAYLVQDCHPDDPNFNQNTKDLLEVLLKYRDKVQLLLEQTFECELEKSEINSITEYRTGSMLNEHADKICESWRDVSNILYYNDDYTGGEIFFSQYDLQFKPKAGSVLIFPAGGNYAHGVNPVTSGDRYVTTTFWVVKKWLNKPYS
jgi:Rps23 Pro-64 3,4-dihydroxylase Tpa1-like proline 4-hydroxylase